MIDRRPQNLSIAGLLSSESEHSTTNVNVTRQQQNPQQSCEFKLSNRLSFF
jgi:hypothetical protein